jgi:hypothetical protein
MKQLRFGSFEDRKGRLLKLRIRERRYRNSVLTPDELRSRNGGRGDNPRRSFLTEKPPFGKSRRANDQFNSSKGGKERSSN